MTISSLFDLEKIPSPLLIISSDKELNSQVALQLAKKLLGEKGSFKVDSGNHPDLHFFIPEGVKSFHSMESMRELIHEINYPPFEAPCKVFIIQDIERMLPSSSNALLKTLEEPNNDCFIIAHTVAPEQLIPTILSRLHSIHLKQEEKKEEENLAPTLERLFGYVLEEEWPKVFAELNVLAEKEGEVVFEALLLYSAKTLDERFFEFMRDLIEQGQKAHLHNVKMRTILLNIFLRLSQVIVPKGTS